MNSRAEVGGTSFTSNTAHTGGAGHLENHPVPSVVEDCDIESHVADSSNGDADCQGTEDCQGGALYFYSRFSPRVTSSRMRGNRAQKGAVFVAKAGTSLSVSSCIMSGNEASNHGGVAHLTMATIISSGNNYSGNAAGGGGAAVHLSANSRGNEFALDTFAGNRATENGGAIYCESSSGLSASKSNFTDNAANQHGGAIALSSSHTVVISDSVLSGNNAARNGGAVDVTGALAPVRIVGRDTLLEDNHAGAAGGGYHAERSFLQIVDATVSANTAPLGGGAAVQNSQDGGELTNVHFVGNRATASRSTMVEAGGLYCQSSGSQASRLSITSSTFELNQAEPDKANRNKENGGGGGLAAHECAGVFVNSTFQNNIASAGGGGILWQGSEDLTLTDGGVGLNYAKARPSTAQLLLDVRTDGESVLGLKLDGCTNFSGATGSATFCCEDVPGSSCNSSSSSRRRLQFGGGGGSAFSLTDFVGTGVYTIEWNTNTTWRAGQQPAGQQLTGKSNFAFPFNTTIRAFDQGGNLVESAAGIVTMRAFNVTDSDDPVQKCDSVSIDQPRKWNCDLRCYSHSWGACASRLDSQCNLRIRGGWR